MKSNFQWNKYWKIKLRKKSIIKKVCKIESTELICQIRSPDHKTGMRSKLKKNKVQFLINLIMNDGIEVEKKNEKKITVDNVMLGGV